jgi:polyisoprenoid-binding protein YceI
MSRRLKIAGILVAVIAAALVGGPWVYINFIREPAAESFLDEASTSTIATSDTTVNSSAPTISLDDPSGTWQVTNTSQVGYRVDEVLFGQNVTAVGRTNAVTGSLVIDDDVVTSGQFVVDMTTVKSDEPKRDAQFESRIMDVINYPTATFVLTSPITLAENATASSTTNTASGELTLRGTTKPISISVIGEVRDGRIVVTGETTVTFGEWGIPNPSIPGISTEDFGILEFQLVLER